MKNNYDFLTHSVLSVFATVILMHMIMFSYSKELYEHQISPLIVFSVFFILLLIFYPIKFLLNNIIFKYYLRYKNLYNSSFENSINKILNKYEFKCYEISALSTWYTLKFEYKGSDGIIERIIADIDVPFKEENPFNYNVKLKLLLEHKFYGVKEIFNSTHLVTPELYKKLKNICQICNKTEIMNQKEKEKQRIEKINNSLNDLYKEV